ncbi:uncharacterized protein LOC129696293 isoform X2 [Leucoraja erinacea]|uniref:uncharacterized protein LOC129696293 isoform X2 n=1 Tax=Leucoraja erinaceus TaxID=7782 RepID=UPI002456A3ED|nr:uncharacterized protein LOC129696293 isoform X2 [Leucoraja erinacea]
MKMFSLEMVMYGVIKKSTPIPLVSERSLDMDLLTYEINIPEDIGLPWKIRLGIGKRGKKTNPTSPLPLSYFKMQNTTTLAAFIYSIQESLPVSSNGDNWIEFPVEWPQRSALSVMSYQIKIYCSDFLALENPASVTLCVYGANGDTGNRSLIRPFHKETGDRQSYLFEINAVQLGNLHTLELSISSAKSKLHFVNIEE